MDQPLSGHPYDQIATAAKLDTFLIKPLRLELKVKTKRLEAPNMGDLLVLP